MALGLGLSLRPVCASLLRAAGVRRYANVFPVTLVGKPPAPSDDAPSPVAAPSALDALVLSQLRTTPAPGLPALIQDYEQNEGYVLEPSLPYESRPTQDRKVSFERPATEVALDNGVVMVAHAFQHQDRHKVAICSGFVLNVPSVDGSTDSAQGDTVVATCAHTLEEMRNSSLLSALLSQPTVATSIDAGAPTPDASHSGSFVMSNAPKLHIPIPSFHPVRAITSSLRRSDLMLLSVTRAAGSRAMPSLPVSPYPVQPGTAVRAHFVVDQEPDEAGWHPWVGGTWSKWVRGTVVGYRDFAGREAKPGTYDALTHLLFQPLPTPGSSGGPIVDEETGAVVGMIVGTRMDSRIDGVRGWGRPAESIFEMFNLPGLNLREN